MFVGSRYYLCNFYNFVKCTLHVVCMHVSSYFVFIPGLLDFIIISIQPIIIQCGLTLSQTTSLDSFKLTEFADYNFKFGRKEIIQKFTKHCGKRRNSFLQAISPFPTVFSKHLLTQQTSDCRLVWDRVKIFLVFILHS